MTFPLSLPQKSRRAAYAITVHLRKATERGHAPPEDVKDICEDGQRGLCCNIQMRFEFRSSYMPHRTGIGSIAIHICFVHLSLRHFGPFVGPGSPRIVNPQGTEGTEHRTTFEQN